MRTLGAYDSLTLSGASSIEIAATNATVLSGNSPIYVKGALRITGGSNMAVSNSHFSMYGARSSAIWYNEQSVYISDVSSGMLFFNNTVDYQMGGVSTTNTETILRIVRSLMVLDEAVLALATNIIVAKGTGPLECAMIGGDVTMRGGGGINLKDNDVRIESSTGEGILSMVYFQQSLFLSGASSLNVTSNNASFEGYTCLLILVADELILANQSALSFTNNNFWMDGRTGVMIYVVSAFLLEYGSTTTIASNTLTYTSVVSESNIAVTFSFIMGIGASEILSGSSVLFNSNTVKVNMTRRGTIGITFLAFSAILVTTISSGSTLGIVGNMLHATAYSPRHTLIRIVEVASVSIVNNSTINIAGNSINATLHSEVESGIVCFIHIERASLDTSVRSSSKLFLQGNIVSSSISAGAVGGGGVLMNINSPISMDNMSTISISGNTLHMTFLTEVSLFVAWLRFLDIGANSTFLLLNTNITLVVFERTVIHPYFACLAIVSFTLSTTTATMNNYTYSAIELAHQGVNIIELGGTASVAAVGEEHITFSWMITFGCIMSGKRSVVNIHHNVLRTMEGYVGKECTVFLVSSSAEINILIDSITLNESSSIVVGNNIVEVGFENTLIAHFNPSTNITITGGSTIYIQDNYIPRVYMGDSPLHIHVCGLFSTTYIGGNSSIYITNNTAVSNTGIVCLFESVSTFPIVMNDTLVVIEGNVVGGTGESDTTQGQFMVNLNRNITDFFRLLFRKNVINFYMNPEEINGSRFRFVLIVNINNNYRSLTAPLLIVQDNIVTGVGNNRTRDGYGCFIVFLQANIPVVGSTPSEFPLVEAVRIANNTITTTNFSMTDIMRVNLTSYVDRMAVEITNNTVTSDEESVSRLATISLSNATSMFSLSTCRNIVNNHMCHETAQGTHSCVAYNPSQVFINDCKTSTLTPSYTPSLTSLATRTSTLTPTHSQHPTLSDPLSTSQTQFPTATAPPTPTTTQPPTPSPSVSLPTTATVHGQSTTPTTTSTPTTTTSRPKSASKTLSQTAIDTATPSISNTGATASRCGLGDSSTFYPLCSVITALRLSREALDDATTSCLSNVTTTISSPLTISVPFDVWGGGTTSPIRLYFKIGARFGPSIIPKGGSDGTSPSTIQSDNGDAESAVATATKGEGEDDFPVISVDAWYTGLPTLGQVIDTIRLPTHTIIRCPINTSGVPYVPSSFDGGGVLGGDEYPTTASIQIGIRIQLEAAEPPLPILEPTITTTVVVAVVGSVISGMPSGLVRGGMVSSLQGMMRCSEFDPEDEVDRINNPPMLAVGSSGMDTLQYQRGSVVIGLAVVGAATITLLLSAVFQVVVLGNVRTVGAGMTMLRMPSSILPIALLVGEMSSGSATTMLLYRSNDTSHQLPTSSIATDALLAIVVLCCTWSVFIYYAYSSTVGCQVIAAPITFIRNMHKKDDAEQQQQQVDQHTVYTTDGINDSFIALPDSENDSDDDNIMLSNNSITQMEWARRRAQLRSFQRLVCFLLEPTHEPSLPLLPARNRNTDNLPSSREGTPTSPTPPPLPQTIRIEELEVWLQRHYFFVAERRWIAYGAAEALLGSLVDIIEGIPVTSRSLAACAFPPATMAIMLILLLTLLLWKWPFAVRIQQWGSMAVVGLLSLVSTLVTINIFIASVELEEVCGYFLLISSILITIFSVLDIIAWLLMLFPCLRDKLGLRPVSLSTALARLRKDAHVPPAMRTEEMATLFIPTHDHHDDDDNPPTTTTQNNEADFYRVAFQVLAHRLRKSHPNQ